VGTGRFWGLGISWRGCWVNQGNRRGWVPQVRSDIADRLIKELEMSLAEVARLLGVSTSAISKILHRTAQETS